MIRITTKEFKNAEEVLSFLKTEEVGYERHTYRVNSFEIIDILRDAKNIEGAGKLLKLRYKDDNVYDRRYYTYISINFDGSSYSVGEEDIDQRLIFPVAGKFKSIFDILEYTDDQVLELLTLARYKRIFELVYAHFVNKHDYEKAQKAISILSVDLPVFLSSARQQDYVPYLLNENNMITIPQAERAAILSSYLNSIYKIETFPVYKLPFDEESHQKIMRMYTKEVQKVKQSELDLKDIDIFDLVESSAFEKNSIFRLQRYESISAFQKMLRQDQERTIKLITRFFNQEHQNGKGKMLFTANFLRMKRILDSKKIEYDVFQLNEKLRGYVLLEILS